MKKKLYFLALILCIFGALNTTKAQETVTIGNGSSKSTAIPFDLYNGTGVCQILYTSSELNTNGKAVINSFALNYYGEVNSASSSTLLPNPNVTGNFKVYLQNTDITKLEDFVPVTEDPSFDGEKTFNNDSWITFDFTSPFSYNGGNLIVTFVDYTGSRGGNFYAFYVDEIQGYCRSSSSSFSPTYMSDLADHSLRPRSQFVVTTGSQPLSLTASAVKTTIYDNETVQLTAVAKGGSEEYTYSWSPATGLDNATSATPIFTPSAIGTYTFTCTVSDGTETANASVTVTVEEAPVETVIGQTGGDYSVLPGYNYYNYSISQQIYTSDDLSDLGKGFKINSISFMPARVNQSARNWSVYLINTTKEQFDSTTGFIVLSESDCLYTGDVNFEKDKWTTINFTKPFTYEGNNILVCVKDNKGSYSYGSNNQYYSIASNGKLLSILNYNDYYSYNVSNVTNYTNYETSGVRSAIKLEYEKVALSLSLSVSADKETVYTGETVQLTATASGGEGNYTYSWSPATGLNNTTSATPTFTPTTAGTYNITCEVTSATETATDNVTIVVNERPTAPSAPTNLQATVNGTSVTLTWDDVSGATSYNVYINNGSPIQTTDPTYTITGLNPATNYCFTVKAVNIGGESSSSNEVCVKTEPEQEPEQVKQYRIKSVSQGTYLTILNNEEHPSGPKGGVGLSAKTENNNQIFTIEDAGYNSTVYFKSATGYYIYCQSWNVDAYLTEPSVSNSRLIMEDAGDGTFYIYNTKGYFKVGAEDGGTSYYPYSNGSESDREKWILEEVGSSTPDVPAEGCEVIFELTSASEDGWGSSAIIVYVGSDEIKLTVESGKSYTHSFIWEQETKFSVVLIKGSIPENMGLTIKYENGGVITQYNIGDFASFNNYSVLLQNYVVDCEIAEPATPEAPIVTAMALSESSIRLRWNEDANATSYKIYDNNDAFVDEVTETSYLFEGLDANTEYCYTVKAVNSFGESDASNKACATTFEDTDGCIVTFNLTDLTDDWNGCKLVVEYENISRELTLVNAQEETFTMEIPQGTNVTAKFVAAVGSEGNGYPQECGFTIAYESGKEILAVDGWTDENYSQYNTTTVTYNFTIDCSSSTDVIIGEGNNDGTNIPIDVLYPYSYSQQSYTRDEITDAGGFEGYITTIAYNVNFISESSGFTRNLKIFMSNAEEEVTFTNNSNVYPLSNDTDGLVFDGEVTFATTGWVEIPLMAPFLYNGDHIVITVIDNTGIGGGVIYFTTHTKYESESEFTTWTSNGNNSDSEIIPTTLDGQTNSLRNNIKLSFIPTDATLEFIGSGSWDITTNWNLRKTPTESDYAIILGDAVITGEATAKSLKVDNGSITLESGSLTVVEGIENNDVNKLVLHDGAQLFQNNADLQGTFVMDINNPKACRIIT